jgi:hypothetical protein
LIVYPLPGYHYNSAGVHIPQQNSRISQLNSTTLSHGRPRIPPRVKVNCAPPSQGYQYNSAEVHLPQPTSRISQLNSTTLSHCRAGIPPRVKVNCASSPIRSHQCRHRPPAGPPVLTHRGCQRHRWVPRAVAQRLLCSGHRAPAVGPPCSPTGAASGTSGSPVRWPSGCCAVAIGPCSGSPVLTHPGCQRQHWYRVGGGGGAVVQGGPLAAI